MPQACQKEGGPRGAFAKWGGSGARGVESDLATDPLTPRERPARPHPATDAPTSRQMADTQDQRRQEQEMTELDVCLDRLS